MELQLLVVYQKVNVIVRWTISQKFGLKKGFYHANYNTFVTQYFSAVLRKQTQTVCIRMPNNKYYYPCLKILEYTSLK